MEEEYGIPTASIQTESFTEVVKQVAYAKGMPHQRFVFVPQPVMGKSPAQLRAYVDGRDPVTGRPVMEEVVDGLTRPLSEEDENPGGFERSTPRWVEADSEENLHRLFLEREWTDRLPIVLPTRERVEAMLAATSHSPEETVGDLGHDADSVSLIGIRPHRPPMGEVAQ